MSIAAKNPMTGLKEAQSRIGESSPLLLVDDDGEQRLREHDNVEMSTTRLARIPIKDIIIKKYSSMTTV